MQRSSFRAAPSLRNSIFLLHSFSSFHSTQSSFAKWKDDDASQQPSKSHIRYSVRYKRADAKNALKDLLLNGKAPGHYFQDENNHRHLKNSERSKPQKTSSGKCKQNKRRQRKKSFSDEDELEQTEKIFTANFGGNESYAWSFNTWENSNHQSSTAGFEWKDDSKSENYSSKFWNESDIEEEEEEINVVDQHSNRIALGLPASGPLCLADVKRAFRVAALKWHPDKHHGLTQAVVAEKFKLCVDAYNSLCNALKSS